MKLRLLLIFLFGLLTAPFGWAQSLTPPRKCATMEQDSINRLLFPRRGTLDEFEQALQRKIQEMTIQGRVNNTVQGAVLNIPIIVHVVHNGEPIGSGLNLSQAQIQSQLVTLNEDFRKLPGTPGFNNHPAGADVEIEFCLSPVDENGITMSEPGIHRYNGGKLSWTRNEIESLLKPSTIWNPNLFYNVWTLRFGGEDASLLGYAQFPDQSGLAGLSEAGGPASTDGVVVQFSSFGSGFPTQQPPYNKGRTMSHETGHWLGLRHIWGDGPCASDFVSDTPTVQAESRGCPTSKLGCDGSTPAMIQNYMDYSDDVCMNIFTNGQKVRMMAVMDLSPRRKTLIETNLCSPIVADVPTANFSSDKQTVLLGGQISYTDLSTNFPNAWAWTFEGGDPNTSTIRNPKVKYNVPGVYKVTLVASNGLGPSLPLEQVDYVTVSEEGLCGSASNFTSSHTPSVISLADFGAFTGFLTGHNSLGSKAVSEFFPNTQGYEFISGVDIRFGFLAFTEEETTLTILVWNARGPQNAPGSVVERKTVLLRQIKADIDNNRPTSIVFDRETPVFGRPYQVGIELDYASSQTLAIVSSANGEATSATSWIKNSSNVWNPFSVAFGANIAMDIKANIGINPSVQVSASKLLIYPSEEVVLNGRGASIFVWNADDGSVINFAGPQLIVTPTVTTTYTATGSGLDLCNTSGSTTIYIRETITGTVGEPGESEVHLFPNPGTEDVYVKIKNNYRGPVDIKLNSITGATLVSFTESKASQELLISMDTKSRPPGIYILQIVLGNELVVRKWLKF